MEDMIINQMINRDKTQIYSPFMDNLWIYGFRKTLKYKVHNVEIIYLLHAHF